MEPVYQTFKPPVPRAEATLYLESRNVARLSLTSPRLSENPLTADGMYQLVERL